MLYIDWCDRRGDERVWVGIADSIGATLPPRWGAHNGWRARGDQDIRGAIATDPTIAVYTHGGQPGTTWDMFGVKASESATTSSSLGSRSATPASGFMTGKDTRTGPSGDMLRNYYRVLFALTGDLSAGNIGPYVDKGDNDIGLLQDFANGVAGTTRPRYVWFQGSRFAEGFIGPNPPFPTFLATYFGATLVTGDYRGYSGNTNDIIDLIPNAPLDFNGNMYSVLNTCFVNNTVLGLSSGFGAAMAARYEDGPAGSNPKIASVYGPNTLPGTAHPMVTLLNGWRIGNMGTWKTLSSTGNILFFSNAMTNLFLGLCAPVAQPIGVGELPNNPLVYFLQLRSGNPVRDGSARIAFGITRRERVELRLYDVSGRVIRTLANRDYDPGEHEVTWDGSDDEGRPAPLGVYFYQLRTPSFVSQKKIALLKR